MHARPSQWIAFFGFVHDLEEHQVRVAIRVVRSQLAPKHHEALYAFTAGAYAPLVVAFRVDIDLDRHASGEHLIDRMIQSADKVSIQSVFPEISLFQRNRIDAQTHVVEAKLRD